jgi:hypothetical protein
MSIIIKVNVITWLPCIYCNNIIKYYECDLVNKDINRYPQIYIDQKNKSPYLLCSKECSKKMRLVENSWDFSILKQLYS